MTPPPQADSERGLPVGSGVAWINLGCVLIGMGGSLVYLVFHLGYSYVVKNIFLQWLKPPLLSL